ncbi:MAG TPA: peptide-methionine (S)-S-oxide reductase MsrA [Longimicrobiaceae bacterium]|nr:peptide-methionine (S)-S-oxide reductase MsrA [Longimicrobiaceae bacterium]
MTAVNNETAVLAGGCFWCLEPVFDQLQGVVSVRPGYTGGNVPDPSYEQVCGGNTGHAEAVKIDFDADVVSFREILEVFFTIHDPTTLNRQGGDTGTQYRSAIFFNSPEQKATADEVIAKVENDGVWNAPIVTDVTPLTEFYPAEVTHQEYYARNPNQPYCQVVIAPKVAKFRKKYADKLKK